jgi:hypothetical protein
VGSSSDQFKLKNIKLVFAASPISTDHVTSKIKGWLAWNWDIVSDSKKNVLKIVLIIVNINKDENKSLISNQFSPKNDL